MDVTAQAATADSNRTNAMIPQTGIIQEITPEVEHVVTYHVALADEDSADTYRFQPGQFNMLYLPGTGEAAISISSDAANRETLDHTIRTAGNVTRGLERLKPGDTIGLRGPFGSSWPMQECVGRDVILVAGGIGLPPLRPVIYQLLQQREMHGQLNLLYGGRSPDVLLFQREYERWSSGGFQVHTTVDRSVPGWLGNIGVVTLLLERLRTFDSDNTIVLCCGPDVMMRFVARTATERGIPEQRIWISSERNMQCAIGLCGHCQLGPEFVCKDGPVFRYDRIAPLMKVEGL